MSLFTTLARLEAQNIAFAMLQIIDSRGSAPRHSAAMVVTEQGEIEGTIGGGMVERLAIEAAREAIDQSASRLFEARLARQGENAVGSDCGGAVTVHIAVWPRRPQLFLLGGGHVNREVAKMAVALDFVVTVADTWPANLEHPDLPAVCRRVQGENYQAIVPHLGLDKHSYVVIATNHEDREALSQTINLPLRYLGLLASKRKAHHLRHWLRQEHGLNEEQVARLHSPLGLKIGAETPTEIAVSIIGELIMLARTGETAPQNIIIKRDGETPPVRSLA
ncbi:XdhC family protein [Mixta tenebrionis]|uniref:XdhC family protein n=1 Tax=Mixta tenebrionis TaxID=2562439 RepID=A0A506VD94_9GAMM|nr:XdhC/CoxI family protein [Mixta tenebrionis]TPW43717.1 XdhC family protein [Mixta tenebrionis]